ncbi:type IV pilus modification protein PilV [Litorilituus lipolyticus]|uniref:Type IV pilus modification protein PilV n=1 Tax=Litorilituus lipolyticus TaxID=2491017 RepID=A0A502L6C4_9GAMM|nr:type IV pilus modification protein PilV [Litorilituus lipolyticus]TPH19236.1 type IV pilus modification protein PilV [Litorilituus lipolyticus]
MQHTVKMLSMKKNKGMTFIEVLVALIIIVTGILGAVAMQATAKQGSFDAMQRSLASSLAQDILARMRANNVTELANYVGTYGENAPAGQIPDCTTAASQCSPAQIRTVDLFEWTQLLRGANVQLGGVNNGGLIEARGCITSAANAVTVIVTWQGRTGTVDGGQAANCGEASDKRRQVRVDGFIFY